MGADYHVSSMQPAPTLPTRQPPNKDNKDGIFNFRYAGGDTDHQNFENNSFPCRHFLVQWINSKPPVMYLNDVMVLKVLSSLVNGKDKL